MIYTVETENGIAVVTKDIKRANSILEVVGGDICEYEDNKWYDTTKLNGRFGEFTWVVYQGMENEDIDKYNPLMGCLKIKSITKDVECTKNKSILNKKEIFYIFTIYTEINKFKNVENEYEFAKNKMSRINEEILQNNIESVYNKYK